MQVRTYRARSLQEALQQVQRELGPETRVVQTKELHTSWWERWTQGRQFEIRARRQATASLPVRRHGSGAEASPAPTQLGGLADEAFALRQRFNPPPVPSEFESPAALGAAVSSSAAVPSLPPTCWFELMTELLDAEIPEVAAREMIDQLRVRVGESDLRIGTLRKQLLEMLVAELPTRRPSQAEGGRRQVVAFVGPTGVGKTTTIAKLAAQFRLRDHRRVALLTVDTYRIAAVEQLRTYAEIMDLPLEVVSTPREMREAMARLSDYDQVLIDTSGRSPQETLPLQQLRAMLQEAQPDEVHLVLGAVSSSHYLQHAYQKFAPLGVSSLLVTKVDEATGLGALCPLLRAVRLPLSYVTCGQSVPDDITEIETERFMRAMLKHEPLPRWR